MCRNNMVHLLTAAEGPIGTSAWDMEHGCCRAVPADPTGQDSVAGLNPLSIVLNSFTAG